jgi:hypothetical protein
MMIATKHSRPHRGASSTFKSFSIGLSISICIMPLLFYLSPAPTTLSIVPIAPWTSRKITIAILCKTQFYKEILYWSNHFIPEFYQRNYSEQIGFWSDHPKDPSIFRTVSLFPVDTTGDISRHELNAKLKAAIENFLFRTTSGWLIRIVGDTAVNFDVVHEVLAELNDQFDPMVDRVIQGACLGKYDLTYVQGGSGFLFSRRAAFDLLQDWAWVRGMAKKLKNDDRLLSVYLQRVNISWYQATNRHFVGHAFWNFSSAWKAVNFKAHRPCIAGPRSKKGCRAYFTRVKDLAFWHDRTRFSRFIGRIDQIRKLAGDHLYFHVPNNKPMLCVSNRSIAGYYD